MSRVRSSRAGICSFYNTPAGCTRGDRCTFQHLGEECIKSDQRSDSSQSPDYQRQQQQQQNQTKLKGDSSVSSSSPAPSLHLNSAISSPIDSVCDLSESPHLGRIIVPTSNLSSNLSISSSSTQLFGRWTRGAPHAQKPVYVPKEAKIITQIEPLSSSSFLLASNSTLPSRHLPSEPWPAVGSSSARHDTSTSAHTAAGISSVAVSSQQSNVKIPGVLRLPAGTKLSSSSHTLTSSAPTLSSKPSKPQPPPKRSNKPRPHTTWTLFDRLDLATLSKLDAITKNRPIKENDEYDDGNIHSSIEAFPSLVSSSTWAASKANVAIPKLSSSSSSPTVASQQVVHKVTSKPSLKPSPSLTSTSSSQLTSARLVRSASHKPSSNLISRHSSTSRQPVRSASVKLRKPKKYPSSAGVTHHKPAKMTPLKRALVHERIEAMARSIVYEMITRATNAIDPNLTSAPDLISVPHLSTMSRRAREQALAALRRKVKHAAYLESQSKREVIQAEQRDQREKRKIEARLKREEEHKQAKERKMKEKMTKMGMAPSSWTENNVAAAITSLHPSAVNSFESSQTFSPEFTFSNGIDSVSKINGEQAASFDSSIENELTSSSNNDNERDDDDGVNSNDGPVHDLSNDIPSHDSDGDGNSEPNSDAESEFVEAAALPSTHILGHFPSDTPPINIGNHRAGANSTTIPTTITSASPSSPLSSSIPSSRSHVGVHVLNSRPLPSTFELTVSEQALLNWHFQSLHHGIQPKLQGAVKRHCKQMWKKEIDEAVTAILKELHRFDVRLRSRDPVKAQTRLRFVSGLKQTFKLLRVNRVKCVIVSSNIEANASDGGLDELLDDILDQCLHQRVPIIFALDRRTLGRAIGLTNAASSVGLLDYSGVGDEYKQLLTRVTAAQEEWAMFQHDSLLNPPPVLTPAQEYEQRRELELIERRQRERQHRRMTQQTLVAKAEEERKAYLLAQKMKAMEKRGHAASGGGSVGKKKKKDRSNHGIQPLPSLPEEDRKGRKGKSKKMEANTNADAMKSSVAPAVLSGSSSSSGVGALKVSSQSLAASSESSILSGSTGVKNAKGKAASSGKKGNAPTVGEENKISKDTKSGNKSGKGGKKNL